MSEKTYYIVEHFVGIDSKVWKAHKRGILSTFNIFNSRNYVKGSVSYSNSKQCYHRLIQVLEHKRFMKSVKPKIIEEVEM